MPVLFRKKIADIPDTPNWDTFARRAKAVHHNFICEKNRTKEGWSDKTCQKFLTKVGERGLDLFSTSNSRVFG